MSKIHPLEAYRRDREISLSKLANMLEISPSYMSRLLNCHRRLGGEMVAKVERLTNGEVTASDIYPDAA